jgi:hypothetical protein
VRFALFEAEQHHSGAVREIGVSGGAHCAAPETTKPPGGGRSSDFARVRAAVAATENGSPSAYLLLRVAAEMPSKPAQ